MTVLYLIRHPETTWNAAKRYQGRMESPLTAEGRDQARNVARAFRGANIDAVFSSPLLRARQLAEELAAVVGRPVQIDQRLTEIGQCPWEGLYLSQIQERYPDLYAQWYTRPDLVRFPHGESLAEVQARAISAVCDLFERFPGGHVLVAAHSVWMTTVVARLLGLELRFIHNLRISNCGITTVCGETEPGSVLTLNDCGPLYGGPEASARLQDCVSWKARRTTS